MRPLDPDLVPELRRKSAGTRRGRGGSRPPNHPERRAEQRFPLANTGIRNHAASGLVLDLSRDGMAIETSTSLRPGHAYTFTLTIGEHVETLRARVLWCRLRATRTLPNGDVLPVYRAGIERIRPSIATRPPDSEDDGR